MTGLNSERFGRPSAAPPFSVRSAETADGVKVSDLAFESGAAAPTDAYLVHGGDPGPSPGVLWFHWLEGGSPTSNRTEFLEEAQALARDGVVSLLVQGTLPWLVPPSSIAADVAAIEREARMARRALDLLAARPEVDSGRLAAVGHDFGGMYLTLLFGTDPRLRALSLLAPTARWGDWFLKYWKIADAADAYAAATRALDPVAWLPAADGRPVLLQFAANDEYVPAAVAAEITAAAGPSARSRTYEAGHDLDVPAARNERRAWLGEVLGLPAR